MGAAGRDKVQAEFDISTEAARLLTLFGGQAGEAVRPAPYTSPLSPGARPEEEPAGAPGNRR